MSLRIAVSGVGPGDAVDWPVPGGTEILSDQGSRRGAVRTALMAGEPFDLLLTTTRHLPDLWPWLVALDTLLDTSDFVAPTIEWATFSGHLYALARSVEVRMLCVRPDMVLETPRTWDAVLAGGSTFGMATRGHGVMAPLIELCEAWDCPLADEDGGAQFSRGPVARAVAGLLRLARERGPEDMAVWSHGDADNALASGRVAMSIIGTEGYRRIRRSRLRDRLWLHTCPSGQSYGCATVLAVPASSPDLARSLELVQLLLALPLQRDELTRFRVPGRRTALAAAEPLDELDQRRLDVVEATIEQGLVALPHLPGWASVERRAAELFSRGLRGELLAGDVAGGMQRAAEKVLAEVVRR
jgi:hypothetical protein